MKIHKIFKRSKKEEVQLTNELKSLRDKSRNVSSHAPAVDRLVADLHGHLEENNLGGRLYLQMRKSRR